MRGCKLSRVRLLRTEARGLSSSTSDCGVVASTETMCCSEHVSFRGDSFPDSPDSPAVDTVEKGVPCGWVQWVCDVPRPVGLRLVFPLFLQASPGFHGPLGELRLQAGIGGVDSIWRLSLLHPQDLSLKKVPLASEMQVRLGGSPRLKSSHSSSQTLCRLNRSFLMPCRFFYAYRTLAFPLGHSSAGWCLPMSVAWRAFRPSIETKLTSSLPPLQLQDSSDHTAHVTKRAFALPSRADCRFAEDRRRSPTVEPPPSQGVSSVGSSRYI